MVFRRSHHYLGVPHALSPRPSLTDLRCCFFLSLSLFLLFPTFLQPPPPHHQPELFSINNSSTPQHNTTVHPLRTNNPIHQTIKMSEIKLLSSDQATITVGMFVVSPTRCLQLPIACQNSTFARLEALLYPSDAGDIGVPC